MIQKVPHHDQSCDTNVNNDRPAICHVIHALGVGGAEVLVDVLARHFSDRYRIVIAVLDEIGEIGERLQRDGFTVEHLQRQPGIDRGCARRLRAFADKEHVSLFHAHQYTPFFQCMLSRGLMGRRPVLFTEHGRHHPDLPSRKRAIVNRLLLRQGDRLVGVGNSVRQALIHNEGLPSDRVDVLYNGVDLESLATPATDARSRIREEFGFHDSDFIAVQVARLHELKDHQTAIRAIERVAAVQPHVRLLIVGEGDCRRAIETEIRDRNLQQHVVLAGGRADVVDLLAAADTFLLSSISEGIPLTIIEAMAARKPVVATRVGGIPEMIEHRLTGFLADAGNAEQLANAVLELSTDRNLRHTMSHAAYEVAQHKFSHQAMLAGYQRMYHEILPEQGGVP